MQILKTVLVPLVLMMVSATAGYLVADRGAEPKQAVQVAPAAAVARPALDAEIAKLTESLYVARQIDAAEIAAARDYLGLSIDLDILSLGELIDHLPPQQAAAALAVLADIHTYRDGQPYVPSAPRETLSDGEAAMLRLRADVQAVLDRAARDAPRGGMSF